MPTHRRCDLVNLQESTLDVLVKYGILADDNSNIVVSMDGSRVLYSKENPRTEIEIELL
jgi:Holliday junction resolvase RusA-like endonuclease